jgi:hypothetical protein
VRRRLEKLRRDEVVDERQVAAIDLNRHGGSVNRRYPLSCKTIAFRGR